MFEISAVGHTVEHRRVDICRHAFGVECLLDLAASPLVEAYLVLDEGLGIAAVVDIVVGYEIVDDRLPVFGTDAPLPQFLVHLARAVLCFGTEGGELCRGSRGFLVDHGRFPFIDFIDFIEAIETIVSKETIESRDYMHYRCLNFSDEESQKAAFDYLNSKDFEVPYIALLPLELKDIFTLWNNGKEK